MKYGKYSGESKTDKATKKEARQIETSKWKGKMEVKTSLEIPRAEKLAIRKENFYDNSKGRALLFEVRAGCLWASIRKAMGYTWSEGNKQTIGHILLECEGIHPNLREGNILLPEALRFMVSMKGVNFKAVVTTKRRLRYWWTKSREKNNT